MTLPSRSTRNLVKFHFTLSPEQSPPFSEVEPLGRAGATSSPLTSILAKQREGDAEVALAEALDLRPRPPGRLLAARHWSQREAEHREARARRTSSWSFWQALVLRREAGTREAVLDDRATTIAVGTSRGRSYGACRCRCAQISASRVDVPEGWPDRAPELDSPVSARRHVGRGPAGTRHRSTRGWVQLHVHQRQA